MEFSIFRGGRLSIFYDIGLINTDSENRVLILSVTVLCGMEF